MVEETCQEEHVPRDQKILQSLGLHVPLGNAAEMIVPKKRFFHFKVVPPQVMGDKEKEGSNIGKHHCISHCITDDAPVVNFDIPAQEVRRRTGFKDVSDVLRYIIIVCNGEINRIKQWASSLTWFEEWFLHLEYMNGRSGTRVEDIVVVYNISREVALSILKLKIDMEICALDLAEICFVRRGHCIEV
jgi:hypothetical protein